MSETKHVESDALWENEEYAIEQYESGKDKTQVFETLEAFMEHLHGLDRSCGK